MMVIGCAPIAAGADRSFATLQISGGTLQVESPDVPAGVSRAQVLEWIQTAAHATSAYYGRFPVQRVTLVLSINSNGHEIHGRTFNGLRIEIGFGPELSPADLKDDWILTHEMFHLAFPDLDDSHEWMNEGLSTYLEPLARARIGKISAEKLWEDAVEGMPQGQPEQGDRGLDRTHTWGRTYWGGCLFWLLADLRIREQTHGKRSLQNALRAILEAGGDGSEEWPVAKVLQVGDGATGTTVLHDLYNEMANQPVTVDLAALWKQLGIQSKNGQVTFDQAAPLAQIRQAMTRPEPPTPNK